MQGCLGGGPGRSREGPGRSGGGEGGPEVPAKNTKTRKTVWLGLLRSNIQDFVQEVPVGQMAQGTPLRCLPLGGGKGEVKPPKCPTRQSGLADIYLYILYIYLRCGNTCLCRRWA